MTGFQCQLIELSENKGYISNSFVVLKEISGDSRKDIVMDLVLVCQPTRPERLFKKQIDSGFSLKCHWRIELFYNYINSIVFMLN